MRAKSYLKHFEKNEDGSYRYKGKYFVCSLKGKEYRREIGRLLALSLVSLALDILAGCFTRTGMENCFYLMLPYALGIALLIWLSWSLIQMICAGERLREYVYKYTAATISWKSACGAVPAAAALIGLAITLQRGSYTGRGPGGALFILSQAVQLTAGIVIFRRNRKLRWLEE